MFNQLYKTIFGDLISNDNKFKYNNGEWDSDAKFEDTQFADYVRCSDWNTKKKEIDSSLSKLEGTLDVEIRKLKQSAKLNYPGAVALVSMLQQECEDFYTEFKNASDYILCSRNGMDVQAGEDDVAINDIC